MPNFRYKALNFDQQPVAGELQAETVQDAIAQLESRGLVLQSIGLAQPEPALGAIETPVAVPNSARTAVDQIVLRTHLDRVLKEGKAIVPALIAYSEEMPTGYRRRELQALIRVLEQGDAGEAEKVFAQLPEYWIPLLSAATASRDPGRVLEEFLKESQRAEELRRQWWLTISYPILIVGIAGTVLALLSVVVVPMFRSIFLEFAIELPAFTMLNLAVAGWIARAWPYLLIGFILLFGGLVFTSIRWPLRSTGFARRLPTLFRRATAIARLSQFVADLLEAGLSVPESLRVAGFLTKGKRLRQAVWRLADQLQLNVSAAQHIGAPRGTATVFYALRSDMTMSSRVQLLREISQAHADRARLGLSWTRGFIEPLAILVVGFVVGGLVVALFLPLIKLVDGLSH